MTEPHVVDLRLAMADDGVDPNDQDAVTDWLAEYYTRASYHEPESTNWYDLDLEQACDLPPVLPPFHLPDESTLAAQARQSTLLADLRSLIERVRITTVQTATVSPFLLALAEETELVEEDGDTLVPGEDADSLDDLTDDESALEAWDHTFAAVVDTTLETADETDPVVGEFDWSVIAAALVMRLFRNSREGVSLADLGDVCKRAVTADFEEDEADRQWHEWVSAHGDPVRLLLEQLEGHGAVSTADDGIVRLEPLGLYAIRSKLVDDGLSVPLLPPPDQMTANDLVSVRLDGTEQDLEDELAAWAAPRGEEQAARELLAFAANADATTRMTTLSIVSQLGPDAEPAWREALDRRELRCYAKTQLARLADLDPWSEELPAELAPSKEDVAWLLTDSLSPMALLDFGDKKVPLDFPEINRVRGLRQPVDIFEIMARLDRPDVESVLALIGRIAMDKQTAKAARRAAYKASTRRAARVTGPAR